MADFLSTIGIKITADTKQAVDAFARLEKAETAAGNGLSMMGKANEVIGALSLPLIKVQAALFTVKTGVELVTIGWQAFKGATAWLREHDLGWLNNFTAGMAELVGVSDKGKTSFKDALEAVRALRDEVRGDANARKLRQHWDNLKAQAEYEEHRKRVKEQEAELDRKAKEEAEKLQRARDRFEADKKTLARVTTWGSFYPESTDPTAPSAASYVNTYEAEMQAAIDPMRAAQQRAALRGDGPGAENADAARMEEKKRKLDDIMQHMQDSTKLGGAGMQALSDGMAAAVDAAISGGDGIAKAMARAAAASLKATAIQASVSALWETAKGIAALAIGSPTAAGHFKAAGMFAATAVAAGGASYAINSLAGGAGSGAGAGASSAGGGYVSPSANRGPEQITVVIQGDVYDADALAERVADATRRARARGRIYDDGVVMG